MSEVKVNKISPRSGTTVTLGDSGDTITLASGVSLTGVNATFSGDLTVDTNTLYVDSANNRVGIRTTSPTDVFQIDGPNSQLRLRDTDDSTYVQFSQSAGKLVIRQNTLLADHLTIDSSGNVGIGTNSPSQALDVVGSIEVSDSIYLGGTGSANALDDYETGTWTPTYSVQTNSFSSVTYDANTYGYYNKIGNLVIARCYIATDAITVGSASGDVYIDGLPFTVAVEITASVGGGGIGLSTAFAGDHPSSLYTIRNTTKVILGYRTSANGANNNNLNVSDLGTGANDNNIQATIIYRVA